MGNEATLRAKVNGTADRGKALLETNEIIFRGTVRCVVKLDAVRARAKAKDGWLMLGPLELELGAQAEKWLQKIKNPKSVLEKLGVKAGQVAWVIGDHAFGAELTRRGLTLGEQGADVIFLFVASGADLKRVAALRKKMRDDATLWLIRPKGSGAAVTEMQARAAGTSTGLVDVKVVGFSPTLSAEKYVVPLSARRK